MAVIARNPSARIGLRAMMEDGRCLRVVADVASPEELDALAEAPEVAVFEYDAEAIEAVLALCVRLLAGCVILGGEVELAARLAHIPLRGWALLPRDAGRDDVIAAVLGAGSGLVVLGGYAVGAIRTPTEGAAESAVSVGGALTTREIEVLHELAGGLANKQIAARLGISVHTVKFHVAAILAKLDAASRTEAVAAGVRSGLVRL